MRQIGCLRVQPEKLCADGATQILGDGHRNAIQIAHGKIPGLGNPRRGGEDPGFSLLGSKEGRANPPILCLDKDHVVLARGDQFSLSISARRSAIVGPGLFRFRRGTGGLLGSPGRGVEQIQPLLQEGNLVFLRLRLLFEHRDLLSQAALFIDQFELPFVEFGKGFLRISGLWEGYENRGHGNGEEIFHSPLSKESELCLQGF